MEVELIAVGSELLLFGRSDTNGDWLSERLQRFGFSVRGRSLVGDDTDRIAAAIRTGLQRATIVAITGGLGPTDDDRTREAVALAIGRPLVRDPAHEAALRAAFAERGIPFHAGQARQSERPEGAEWIPNPIGSAAGLWIESDDRVLIAMPGVPAEMKRMVDLELAERLEARATGRVASATLKVAGRGETQVDRAVRDLYGSPGLQVTILSGAEGIELKLLARGDSLEAARERIASAELAMSRRLGDDLYGRDDDTMARVVGRALRERNATIAVAESCTGGLLGAELTREAGASSWFRGGFLVYADDLKQSLAGVDRALIDSQGAVSQGVALALARGARERCGADFGFGITGVAGPGGGTPEKPIGLVHVALAGPDGAESIRRRMVGDRELIRRRTVLLALDLLRRRLIADPRSPGG